LDVAHGPVYGEGHAVARDDGVVDHVRVGELFVHHIERLDKLVGWLGLVGRSVRSMYEEEKEEF
jgi:hypothetical protein